MDTPPTTTPDAPSVSWLLIREGDWARLFQISGASDSPATTQGLADLKRHCEGAYQSQEPLGDVWCLPQDQGEPQRVRVIGSATPYDDDDYTTQTLMFYLPSDPSLPINHCVICTVSFRLDGRS